MKAIFKRLMKLTGGAVALATSTGAVMAESGIKPWQLGLQASDTDVMDSIHSFNNLTLGIVTVITLFVLALLVIVMVRFNSKANPTPSRTSHNTMIEVVWTIVPILILVVIAIPSFRLLFKQLDIPEYDMTVKVTGYQWYWGYEYTDHEFGFESFLLAREDLEDHGYSQDEYLLATDTAVVVPVGKTVVMDVTAADVIHSWTIPAFGVKQDAVPGRIAQLWFNAEKEGVYFGQCSELCGKDHAYMPITVKVVSQEEYDEWLDGAIEEYAGTPRNVDVASVAE